MRPPEVRYLNLEYIFNEFFGLFSKIFKLVSDFLVFINSRLFKIISILLSSLFLAGIIFVIYKLYFLGRKRKFLFDYFLAETETTKVRAARWDEIKKLLDSKESMDWKKAVLGADALVDEILSRIGYKGADLAERLKSIEPSDFENLQGVWEATMAKNRIVTEAEQFVLTKEEAKNIVEKYEKALKEFGYL